LIERNFQLNLTKGEIVMVQNYQCGKLCALPDEALRSRVSGAGLITRLGKWFRVLQKA